MDSAQDSEGPWVAQRKPKVESNKISMDRPEDGHLQMLPIQSDYVWEDLPGRNEETAQIQM